MGKERILCRGIGDARAVEQKAGCFVRSRSSVSSDAALSRPRYARECQAAAEGEAPRPDRPRRRIGHLRPIGGRIDRRQLPRRYQHALGCVERFPPCWAARSARTPCAGLERS